MPPLEASPLSSQFSMTDERQLEMVSEEPAHPTSPEANFWEKVMEPATCRFLMAHGVSTYAKGATCSLVASV